MDKTNIDDLDRYERIALAKRHDLSIELAEELFSSGDVEVQKTIVLHPIHGRQFQKRAVMMDNIDLVTTAAMCTNDTSVLRYAISRPDFSPALAVLRRGAGVPSDILSIAVDHPIWKIRQEYAGSKYVTEADAERLVQDADKEVLKALAGNPVIPKKIRAMAALRISNC